jgi:hypothetical protein
MTLLGLGLTVAARYDKSRSMRILAAGFVPPCLPIKAQQPPSGPLWLHEIAVRREEEEDWGK